MTFGRSVAGNIQLSTSALPNSVGFCILGAAATDRSGYSVGAAGDVNGDGVGDIIIEAPQVDPPNGADAGIA